MKNVEILKKIADVYSTGGNIIKYLKSIDGRKANSIEDILISYDFQAGTYIDAYNKSGYFLNKYTSLLAKELYELDCNFNSIFEPGVGEATTLKCLLNNINNVDFKFIGGLDLSWSRVRYAIEFLKLNNAEIFVGDMFNIPLKDNSIDLVYTSHALEPNGGHEEELIRELYRITNKYLILLEPVYELADDIAKRRMDEHGYIKNLYFIIKKLGYKIIKYELFGMSIKQLNPTGLIIIEKNRNSDIEVENKFICPITKTELKKYNGYYFTKEGLVSYPIIDNVPILINDYAVVTTKMEKFLSMRGDGL